MKVLRILKIRKIDFKLPVLYRLYTHFKMVKTFMNCLAYWPSYGLWLRGVVFRFLGGTKVFKPTLGSTKPFTQWVQGALSSGVKRPGLEAEHSTLM